LPTRQYDGNQLNNFLRPNINRGVEIFDQNEKLLFSSTPEVPRSINWSNSEIRDVAERLNLINISTEFYPSSESQTLADKWGIKVDYQSHETWSTWFQAITKGKSLLPDTNILVMRTIRSVIFFNKGSGREIPDALIREEIQNYGGMTDEKTIYLTRDMVSALTANAEDLDAIYMAPKSPDQTTLVDIGLREIREMIIETATDYGSIVLRWDNDASFKIDGVWSGKNWYDYSRQRVRVTPI